MDNGYGESATRSETITTSGRTSSMKVGTEKEFPKRWNSQSEERDGKVISAAHELKELLRHIELGPTYLNKMFTPPSYAVWPLPISPKLPSPTKTVSPARQTPASNFSVKLPPMRSPFANFLSFKQRSSTNTPVPVFVDCTVSSPPKKRKLSDLHRESSSDSNVQNTKAHDASPQDQVIEVDSESPDRNKGFAQQARSNFKHFLEKKSNYSERALLFPQKDKAEIEKDDELGDKIAPADQMANQPVFKNVKHVSQGLQDLAAKYRRREPGLAADNEGNTDSRWKTANPNFTTGLKGNEVLKRYNVLKEKTHVKYGIKTNSSKFPKPDKEQVTPKLLTVSSNKATLRQRQLSEGKLQSIGKIVEDKGGSTSPEKDAMERLSQTVCVSPTSSAESSEGDTRAKHDLGMEFEENKSPSASSSLKRKASEDLLLQSYASDDVFVTQSKNESVRTSESAYAGKPQDTPIAVIGPRPPKAQKLDHSVLQNAESAQEAISDRVLSIVDFTSKSPSHRPAKESISPGVEKSMKKAESVTTGSLQNVSRSSSDSETPSAERNIGRKLSRDTYTCPIKSVGWTTVRQACTKAVPSESQMPEELALCPIKSVERTTVRQACNKTVLHSFDISSETSLTFASAKSSSQIQPAGGTANGLAAQSEKKIQQEQQAMELTQNLPEIAYSIIACDSLPKDTQRNHNEHSVGKNLEADQDVEDGGVKTPTANFPSSLDVKELVISEAVVKDPIARGESSGESPIALDGPSQEENAAAFLNQSPPTQTSGIRLLLRRISKKNYKCIVIDPATLYADKKANDDCRTSSPNAVTPTPFKPSSMCRKRGLKRGDKVPRAKRNAPTAKIQKKYIESCTVEAKHLQPVDDGSEKSPAKGKRKAVQQTRNKKFFKPPSLNSFLYISAKKYEKPKMRIQRSSPDHGISINQQDNICKSNLLDAPFIANEHVTCQQPVYETVDESSRPDSLMDQSTSGLVYVNQKATVPQQDQASRPVSNEVTKESADGIPHISEGSEELAGTVEYVKGFSLAADSHSERKNPANFVSSTQDGIGNEAVCIDNAEPISMTPNTKRGTKALNGKLSTPPNPTDVNPLSLDRDESDECTTTSGCAMEIKQSAVSKLGGTELATKVPPATKYLSAADIAMDVPTTSAVGQRPKSGSEMQKPIMLTRDSNSLSQRKQPITHTNVPPELKDLSAADIAKVICVVDALQNGRLSENGHTSSGSMSSAMTRTPLAFEQEENAQPCIIPPNIIHRPLAGQAPVADPTEVAHTESSRPSTSSLSNGSPCPPSETNSVIEEIKKLLFHPAFSINRDYINAQIDSGLITIKRSGHSLERNPAPHLQAVTQVAGCSSDTEAGLSSNADQQRNPCDMQDLTGVHFPKQEQPTNHKNTGQVTKNSQKNPICAPTKPVSYSKGKVGYPLSQALKSDVFPPTSIQTPAPNVQHEQATFRVERECLRYVSTPSPHCSKESKGVPPVVYNTSPKIKVQLAYQKPNLQTTFKNQNGEKLLHSNVFITPGSHSINQNQLIQRPFYLDNKSLHTLPAMIECAIPGQNQKLLTDFIPRRASTPFANNKGNHPLVVRPVNPNKQNNPYLIKTEPWNVPQVDNGTKAPIAALGMPCTGEGTSTPAKANVAQDSKKPHRVKKSRSVDSKPLPPAENCRRSQRSTAEIPPKSYQNSASEESFCETENVKKEKSPRLKTEYPKPVKASKSPAKQPQQPKVSPGSADKDLLSLATAASNCTNLPCASSAPLMNIDSSRTLNNSQETEKCIPVPCENKEVLKKTASGNSLPDCATATNMPSVTNHPKSPKAKCYKPNKISHISARMKDYLPSAVPLYKKKMAMLNQERFAEN